MTRGQKILAGGIALSACGLLVLTVFFALSLGRGLHTPQASRLLLDRRGAYLGEVRGHAGRRGYWPVGHDLPDKVVQATLETEDRQFFEHAGVYLPSVLRALIQNLAQGKVVSGASTIAMQVARLQRPGPRTYWRKAREAAEAWLIVRDFGHDRVLRQYLTLAPYGNRVRGIRRAARYYFDKPVQDLSWLQAAFLAGLPQSPGRMDPHAPAGLARAHERARRILRNLQRRGIIDSVELAQALGSELGLVPRPKRQADALHAVLRLSEQAAGRPGLIQQSSLDLDMQGRVSHLLRQNLNRLRWRGAGNTAALVVDRASGQVLAYVGSADYFAEDPRGAIDYVRTRRPPGSALKPFIYALGLQTGKLTAASELSDIQVEFNSTRGVPYRPNNIGRTFLGPMLAREALANSRNIPALQVLARVGVEPALAFFEQAGVAGIDYQPDRYGLGLALGNLHVTLEELVRLYGVLANEGRRLDLRYFLTAEPASETPQLLPPAVAQLVGHILADSLARQPSFPRGTALEYDYTVSVKTGTSQGYRDGWAVAYSDRLLVGVWIGNHDWRRMNKIGGLAGAGRVVHEIMDALMSRYKLHRPLAEVSELPEGAQARSVCALSGKLAGPACPTHRTEYFLPGSEPYETCPYHRKVRVDRRNGLKAGPHCPPAVVAEIQAVDLPERYAAWARKARMELAPQLESPLCGPPTVGADQVIRIEEPHDGARYVWDPDTPAEFATVRLAAAVEPSEAPIVWLVDDVPVARVSYPHEFRWTLAPGRHTIRAAMLEQRLVSAPVSIEVKQ